MNEKISIRWSIWIGIRGIDQIVDIDGVEKNHGRTVAAWESEKSALWLAFVG